MLKLDSTALCLSLKCRLTRTGFRQRTNHRRIFYLLAVSYGRLQKGDDDVTVPLLSASKGRRDEENLTGLPNPCSLSIGGHDPSYAYQILNHFMFFAWMGRRFSRDLFYCPFPFGLYYIGSQKLNYCLLLL
jgi:hypothetical protein